jgi:hypothetical protein
MITTSSYVVAGIEPSVADDLRARGGIDYIADEKPGSKDVFTKLERLSQLKDKGVISVDDYEAMKKKLLDTV